MRRAAALPDTAPDIRLTGGGVMGETRVTVVVEQSGATASEATVVAEIRRDHERLRRALSGLKWHLWHGQRRRARRTIGDLLFTMRLAGITYRPVIRKMRRRVKELSAYLTVNADSLPDYGRRHRAGERVASSFIESAVNQLVDKRMSKSQQMRWSRAGAHLLLQVRAEVVDGRLGE